GAILSSGMMLAHLGLPAEAAAIEAAVSAAIRARECTRDIGGELSTADAGDAVVKHLKGA
ncbi:MAG TPA: isocitrate/isopropylmalate family dehydrogenase, partial [Candidatus Dormibacteraeota bacterium]